MSFFLVLVTFSSNFLSSSSSLESSDYFDSSSLFNYSFSGIEWADDSLFYNGSVFLGLYSFLSLEFSWFSDELDTRMSFSVSLALWSK